MNYRTRLCIDFDLFGLILAIEMWPTEFYDFLAQIDGDYE
jgi:hypothetical protein